MRSIANKTIILGILLSIVKLSIAQTPGLLWNRNFGSENHESGRMVSLSADGQYIYTAADSLQLRAGTAIDSSEILVIQLNRNGDRIGHFVYGGSGNDRIRRMFRHPDGSTTVIAYTNSNDRDVTGHHGGGDIWVVRLNPAGAIVWQKCFGGSQLDDYRNAAVLPDNSIIIAGYTNSNDGDVTGFHAGNDIWIIKVSNTGNLEWQKCLGGSGDDRPRDVTALADGSFAVTAFSFSNDGDAIGNHGSADLWMIRLDASGNIIWKSMYGGSGAETGYRCYTDNNGNLVVLAETTSNNGNVSGNHGFRDCWVININVTTGALIWQRCIGGSGAENPRNMIRDMNGNYFIGAQTLSADGNATGFHGIQDILLAKLDQTGNILFSKCLGGSQIDDLIFYISPFNGLANTYQNNMMLDSADNSCVLLGYTMSDNGDVSGYHYSRPSPDQLPDLWVVKVDGNGNLVWQKCVGGSGSDQPGMIQKISTDRYVITGVTTSYNGDLTGNFGNSDIWVVQLGPVSKITVGQYADMNLNGIKDANEPVTDLLIHSEKTGVINRRWPLNGWVTIDADTGIYSTRLVPQNGYYQIDPLVHITTFSSYNLVDTVLFRLIPVPGKRDISTGLVSLEPARPGFPLTYKIICRNNGTDTVTAGEVTFIRDNRLSFVNASPAPNQVIGDTIRWSYSAFKPFDTLTYLVNMQTGAPPLVNIGDTLSSIATIAPLTGDLVLGDNESLLRQITRGSFDPNDKRENTGGSIRLQEIQNGQWLYYIIRFQNTGNDTAHTVTVRDTLDPRLDWNSTQMLSASHTYELRISGQNKLEWIFNNILLPGQLQNEPLSHGHIAFRIKPGNFLSAGDSMLNRASIYFDYNLPVVTNDAITYVIGDTLKVCPGQHVFIHADISGTTYQWQADTGSGYVNIQDNGIYSGTTNAQLSISNAPTFWYGNKYRCLINGPGGLVYSNEITLRFQAVWTGNSGQQWSVPGNWSCGIVPDGNTDVIIPSAAFNRPLVNMNSICRSLYVQSTSSLTVGAGLSLEVKGGQ